MAYRRKINVHVKGGRPQGFFVTASMGKTLEYIADSVLVNEGRFQLFGPLLNLTTDYTFTHSGQLT